MNRTAAAMPHVTASDVLDRFPVTLCVGLVGGALVAWGARRTNAMRVTAGVSGVALLAAALARGEWERQRAAAARRPVGVPEDRVFEFWSHYEDEPRERRTRRQPVGA